MPAKSKAQARAARIAHAAKKGKIPKSRLRGASLSMFESMSSADMEKYIHTKEKGLPMHAKKKRVMRHA